jgi:hypothetical protein
VSGPASLLFGGGQQVLGLRSLRGIVAPLACALMSGCGGTPTDPTRMPAPSRPAANPQTVVAKLHALCDEGVRRYPGDAHTHAEVSGWYLAELDTIELSGCPADFVERFQSYKQAWDAIRQRSQQPPEGKRGITSYVVLFMQLKDELSPQEYVHSRGDDALLNTLLIRARELKRVTRTK